MKKSQKCAFAVALLLLISPCSAYAKDVSVQVPSFPVSLNGQAIDSTYSQHPLLVYKGITYFPMTYDYARFMKLKTGWYPNARGGSAFFVGVAEDSAKTLTYGKTAKANEKAYTAKIPSYRIAVNTTWILAWFWAPRRRDAIGRAAARAALADALDFMGFYSELEGGG